jgi:hypothetical protein
VGLPLDAGPLAGHRLQGGLPSGQGRAE